MWSALYVLSLLSVALIDARGRPVVETSYGTVRGKWLSSARNLSVAAYLGIPYAEPPVGELRFQSPKPWTRQWNNIFDATKDGSMCVQLDSSEQILGDEDCLNLNIFVPLILSKRKLPVLVFVHGGGFNTGSNNSTYYAPDYLADQEIILVTVNYRLGIFGFLSTATERVPGNAGLKDILESLRWIQKNIFDFGGDPNMVTLYGQSAGAAAVHHLALSNSTEGLFNRYITQSGSAFAPWAIHAPLIMRARYIVVAKKLGCVSGSKFREIQQYVEEAFTGEVDLGSYNEALEEDETILHCFRSISPRRLAMATQVFHIWKMSPYCNFGPTVEINSDDAIIIRHPKRTVELGELRDIPWLTGLVADEGLIKTAEVFENRELADDLEGGFDKIGVFFLESEEIVPNTTAFIASLVDFYFPPDIEMDNTFLRERNLTRMAGDGLITWPSYQALNYQSAMMNSSIYFYLFSYEGTFSNTYANGIPRRYGVAHSDDLNYLFPCLNGMYADLQLHNTGNDWAVINIMTEWWASFIKEGAPNARLTLDWEPYQKNYRYMSIGSGRSPEIGMEEDFWSVRMGFWQYLMSNMSAPMEKLFPDNLDGEPSELEEEQSSKANSLFSGIPNILLFFVIYALF